MNAPLGENLVAVRRDAGWGLLGLAAGGLVIAITVTTRRRTPSTRKPRA
jgi:hypothetical protein